MDSPRRTKVATGTVARPTGHDDWHRPADDQAAGGATVADMYAVPESNNESPPRWLAFVLSGWAFGVLLLLGWLGYADALRAFVCAGAGR